jgi:hypothetical protein
MAVNEFEEIFRRASTPAFETFGALMHADQTGKLSDEEFDRNVWLLVCRVIQVMDDYDDLPIPVLNYYASRRMEWDVGNGGFAQAAYNMPEWFEAAARGYEAIGHADAAALIRRALAISKGESGIVAKLKRRGAGIGAIFKSFRESSLSDLGGDLPVALEKIGWWATTNRLAYVRRNRSAFLALE